MIAAVVAVVVHAIAIAGATPEARQVYGITWASPAVEVGPCALSIVLPASEAERCASWTRRESSGPAFHPGLGVVVVGGSSVSTVSVVIESVVAVSVGDRRADVVEVFSTAVVEGSDAETKEVADVDRMSNGEVEV